MNVNLCDGKFHGRVHVTHVCDELTEVRISIHKLNLLNVS